jgi:hypothetical protein
MARFSASEQDGRDVAGNQPGVLSLAQRRADPDNGGMTFDDQGLEVLDEPECFRLLADGWLGRLGLCRGGVPAIFPVNYHFTDGAVWFRTGPGVKLDAAEQGDTVAFEADSAGGPDEEAWSVLAIGPASVVVDPGEEAMLDVPVRPWAPGRRDFLVRVVVDFVSGLRISQYPPGGPDCG